MGYLMANIDESKEKVKRQLAEFNLVKNKLISALDKLMIKPEVVFNLPSSINNNISVSFKDNLNTYISMIRELLENNNFEGITTNYLRSLTNEIEDLIRQKELTIAEKDLNEFNLKTRNIINNISIVYNEFNNYLNLKNKFNQLSFNAISECLAEVKDELSSFRRLRHIADTALTENIYNNAVTKYQKIEKKYRKYFYRAIAIVLLLAVLLLLLKSKVITTLGINNTEFWVLKISLMIVGITLISYFLKQTSHYQKLADQNYQTQVELQAYPSFMESVPTNEAAIIRKELALKYFGKEIDGSTHKDMSNLISDQMKNTTEMIKATTDVLKQKQ